MGKINVFLQYPWKISDSQYYKSMLDSPPKDIIYINNNNRRTGMVVNKHKIFIAKFLKEKIRWILRRLNITIINIRKTSLDKGYDIIHCAHCLSSNNSPWVADFESVWQMRISGYETKIGQKKVLNILKKNNCKRIIAWTEASKKEILKKYPEIQDKVRIVSYALPFPKIKKKKSKNVRLLFVGRYFRRKGGLHTLEAFDRLTKKYKNVEAIMISTIPEEIKKKYSKNKKIKFYGLMPYDQILKEIYSSSDIFLYPGYSDTFGFSFGDALSFGLPTITVDGFARKEIIEDGKTGFIIPREGIYKYDRIGEKEERIIQKMVEKTSKLIENKKLLNKMSKNCIYAVKEGKFSIKERNKKLKQVYLDALK